MSTKDEGSVSPGHTAWTSFPAFRGGQALEHVPCPFVTRILLDRSRNSTDIIVILYLPFKYRCCLHKKCI